MTDQSCSNCGIALEKPYPANSNYASGIDFSEKEPKEVHYALFHTELTKRRLDFIDEQLPDRDRQALNAEMANPNAPDRVEIVTGTEVVEEDGAEVETAKKREVGFSIPVDMFKRVEVDTPQFGLENDDVALVLTDVEEREVQKTGLICSNCTDPEKHEIIWGIDSE